MAGRCLQLVIRMRHWCMLLSLSACTLSTLVLIWQFTTSMDANESAAGATTSTQPSAWTAEHALLRAPLLSHQQQGPAAAALCDTPAAVCYVHCAGPCAQLCEPCDDAAAGTDGRGGVCSRGAMMPFEEAMALYWAHSGTRKAPTAAAATDAAPTPAAPLVPRRSWVGWDWPEERVGRGTLRVDEQSSKVPNTRYFQVAVGFAPSPTTYVHWSMPVFSPLDIAFNDATLPMPPLGSGYIQATQPFLVRHHHRYALLMSFTWGMPVRHSIGYATLRHASQLASMCVAATAAAQWGCPKQDDAGIPSDEEEEAGSPGSWVELPDLGEDKRYKLQWGGLVQGLPQGVDLFHPYTFVHNGEAYMLPHAPGEAVVLYRAEAQAPEASYSMAPVHSTLHAWASHWVPVATLVPKELPFDAQHDGLSRLEPSLVNWQDRWYLFVPYARRTGVGRLVLYHADRLLGPYTRHPASPIATVNANTRRHSAGSASAHAYSDDIVQSAGRVVALGNQLVRYTRPHVRTLHPGMFVQPTLITRLDANGYAETSLSPAVTTSATSMWGRRGRYAGNAAPGVRPSKRASWRQRSSRHVDAHRVFDGTTCAQTGGADLWMFALDGMPYDDVHEHWKYQLQQEWASRGVSADAVHPAAKQVIDEVTAALAAGADAWSAAEEERHRAAAIPHLTVPPPSSASSSQPGAKPPKLRPVGERLADAIAEAERADGFADILEAARSEKLDELAKKLNVSSLDGYQALRSTGVDSTQSRIAPRIELPPDVVASALQAAEARGAYEGPEPDANGRHRVYRTRLERSGDSDTDAGSSSSKAGGQQGAEGAALPEYQDAGLHAARSHHMSSALGSHLKDMKARIEVVDAEDAEWARKEWARIVEERKRTKVNKESNSPGGSRVFKAGGG